MKTTLIYLLVVIISMCGCGSQTDTLDAGPLKITYDPNGTASLIESDIVDSITIIPLQTTPQCLLGQNPSIYYYGDQFFVADQFSTKIVHRFDRNGNYMNSIGKIGPGPGEYIGLSDFSIGSDNTAVIFCSQTKSIHKYNLDGKFIEKLDTELPLFQGLINADNTFWTYLGYANTVKKGRIVQIDVKSNVIREGLNSDCNVMPMQEITPVFSKYNDKIFVRESMSNIVYLIENDTVKPAYEFDFGKYNVPKEYWEKASLDESIQLLMSMDFVALRRYMENDDYRLVEAQIQQKVDPRLILVYGLQNKNTEQWDWFSLDAGELQPNTLFNSVGWLTDDNELLCLVAPGAVKSHSDFSKFRNSQIIEEIKDDDNYVVLSCKLK